MRLAERFWKTLVHALGIANLSPYGDEGIEQRPLLGSAPPAQQRGGPVFAPPGGDPYSPLQCQYPTMKGYRHCSTAADRSCWLVNDDGDRFDIHTDYEKRTPVGITRKYELNITDGSLTLDGLPFNKAKVFNEKYPGPWLQACWGDTLQITVNNRLRYNGTSIHWHGIRQYRTMHMDGVNGITQCPIKPGASFVYEFKATQYGSSWYHSHYSIQYADGLVGPLTIHGPTSAPFDEPADIPLLVTDWGHNSAFSALYSDLEKPSILLNGRGNVTRYSGVPSTVEPLKPYTLQFVNQTDPGPKRYLLRIINTSYLSTFVFSIDNHYLTVVSADFVPIHPYSNTSILVGIGQRYNVIVEAAPQLNLQGDIPTDGNFWIRTYVAFCGRPPPSNDCSELNGHPAGYEQSGILRYNSSSKSDPRSQPWRHMSCACSDETYTSLRPVVPWYVGSASNGAGQEFDVILNNTARDKGVPYRLANFALQPPNAPFFNPLQIDYGQPTFLYLNQTSGWNSSLVIIPEDFTDNDWVYLVIAGDRKQGDRTTGAHPIHLHGHDFALVQQAEGKAYSPANYRPTLDNPPRRDVVLLPRNGFVVIAFRTDNPGAWLMHCHIARHASEGLALQILERRRDADIIWPRNSSPAVRRAEAVCADWRAWQADCRNWEGGCGSLFQDDSGI